jgi:hemolysin activation/secretion protein
MGNRLGGHVRYSVLAAAATCAPYMALAQQAPQVPTPLPPALPQTQQPGRDQVTIPVPEAPATGPQAEVQSSTALNAGPCPPEIQNSDTTVTLRELNFVQVTGEAVKPVIASLLSGIAPPEGAQPVRVVCELRDQAMERLRRAGYVAAVQIPPQELADGRLTLNVITARLTQVRVIGDAGGLNKTIADRIEQLKAVDPLNEREAQRILLLASDVPGLRKVQLTLRASPSGTVGEVVGDLEVAYEPIVILANAQNFGSRALGRETGYLSASMVGLTGLADVTNIAASTTGDFKEQLVGQVGHHFQLGTSGFTFGGSFTYAVSRPDLDQLELKSRSMVGTIDVSVPLVRSIANTLRLGAGIDLIEQRTQVLNADTAIPLNRDRLRIAWLRMDGNAAQAESLPGGQLIETAYLGGTLEARQGLNILDASRLGQFAGDYGPSRPEGDPKATVIRGAMDGRLRFKRFPVIFAVAAQGQWSSDPLLNFEEFSLGNLTLGRGYDPGSNSADRAFGVRTELRVPLPLKSRVEVEPFAFYDHVHIWNRDSGSTENDRALRSYGGGARLRLPGLLYLEVMYAHPRDPALRLLNSGRPKDRLLVSLTARLAPRL